MWVWYFKNLWNVKKIEIFKNFYGNMKIHEMKINEKMVNFFKIYEIFYEILYRWEILQ